VKSLLSLHGLKLRPRSQRTAFGRGAVAAFVALAMGLHAQAAAPASQVELKGSIKGVELAPQIGPIYPHKAFITRKTLKQAETRATMEFEVALSMRNFPDLQRRINKGEIISPQEMARKYEPTAADERAVAHWLKSQGLTLAHRSKNHLAIFVRGRVSTIAQVLHVQFARVASEGVEYTSAITAPSIPAAIASRVVGINGLQPHLRAHKRSLAPASLTGTAAPYTPGQIAHVYSADALFQSNVTGAGQSIAIAIDTFPSTSDLQGFWSTYGINQSLSNISFIQVVAGTLPAPTGEETLDTEWSSAMAPGAKVRIYASHDLTFASLDQVYEQIYTDATTHPSYGIHQISLSYAAGETATTASEVQTDAQYFASLAAAGVTVFAASGDGGAYPNALGQTGGNTTEQTVVPASDVNVTGVGGTSLVLDGNGNVSSEEGWSESGGGSSIYASRPAWQVGPGVPPGSARVVPDVAVAADPNEGAAYYFNGAQQSTGGTSWSCPTWAGFCALINQKRASASLSSIGVLGPRIYPLIGTANFRDITSGTNGFIAGAGYDPVTGIGVPNMQTLATTLAGTAVTSTYTPPPTPILHSFNDGGVVDDGQSPAGMVLGTDGNFYGVTSNGGSSGAGSVFKMTPQGTPTILHSFGDGTVTNDGAHPNNGLALDSNGNLYGTTQNGGANGFGAIFKTAPSGTTTILYSFNAGYFNGTASEAGITAGEDGNFYGITTNNQFYSITPTGSFTAVQTLSNIVYTNTSAPMIRGADGNFYGTTIYNNEDTGGSIFRVTPQGTATVLDYLGSVPYGELVQGSDGNFYGTAGGTIFEMTLQGAITTLHTFGDGSVANDGQNPGGNLVIGADGNLYGTTSEGGTAGQGVVFKLTLGAQNVESIVHSFGDGSVPNDGTGAANLLAGPNGLIFGTTGAGGANNEGAAFAMTYFTSPPSATFVVGYSGTFTATTAEMQGATFTATGLPAWASLSSSGVLTGTPPSTAGAPFTGTFTVTNGTREGTNVQVFTLDVVAPMAPAFTSTAPTGSATVGTPYSFSCQASGSPASVNFTVTAGP